MHFYLFKFPQLERTGAQKSDFSAQSFRNSGERRARYVDLYSVAKRTSGASEQSQRRISFMSNEETPYTALLIKNHQQKTKQLRQSSQSSGAAAAAAAGSSVSADVNEDKPAVTAAIQESTEEADAVPSLLELVRSRRQSSTAPAQRDASEDSRKALSEEQVSETCVHGMSMRERDTERSRSRSRTSTRRDIDLHSILAFPPYASIKKPIEAANKMVVKEHALPPPRWSLRRSICPVCSQKWKDRSSIRNVKSSGLRRNSSQDYPASVIAPARLQTAIKAEYNPRPVLVAVDDGAGVSLSGLRGGGAAWQLSRARRYRPLPPRGSDATPPPPPRTPLAPADLDRRVNLFLAG